MSHYHHGNLRNALIVAAGELIEERGSSDFSMIDASRRAGVSSAAPYRHFKDKEALLDALCQVAFMALAEATESAAADLEKGTAEHIVLLGKAYIKFVTGHPEFYDLMWGEHSIRAMDAGEEEIKSSGFYVLIESLQIWCDNAGLDNCDPVSIATQLWATVHGMSGLAINKHIDHFTPDIDIYNLLENSTHTFLAGLTSNH